MTLLEKTAQVILLKKPSLLSIHSSKAVGERRKKVINETCVECLTWFSFELFFFHVIKMNFSSWHNYKRGLS